MGSHKETPRLLGSKGRKIGVVTVAVRPSPAWARRRRRGGGVGGPNQRVSDGVREAARTRKVATTARVGFGRDRGVAAGNATEPGRRHGRRRARRPRSALESACECG
jgi:hypothetical protein